ncbi:MAG: aspartate aminotransferase family protein, partial [Spirulinaceae cyanobacterium]
KKPGTYEQLDKITKRLSEGLLSAAKESGHEVSGGQISAMFGMFFTGEKVKNYDDAKKSDLEKFSRFHRGMLERGIYLAPSQFEAGFTSLAHSEEDVEQTIAAAKEVLADL